MPPGQRRYEVQLASKSGPIDVFLIQDPTAVGSKSGAGSSAYAGAYAAHGAQLHTDPIAQGHRAAPLAHLHPFDAFHGAEMLKPFDLPLDAFSFEMKAEEGPADLYGLVEPGKVGAGSAPMDSLYNVFS